MVYARALGLVPGVRVICWNIANLLSRNDIREEYENVNIPL